ncbi:hypothetical protein [Klebsiella pneumoniae]
MIDFYLSPTRSAKAAKRFLGKRPARPEAPGKARHAQYRQSAELWCSDHRIEARWKSWTEETAQWQVKYLNNVIEADHGKPKILMKMFCSMVSNRSPLHHATITRSEVKRALRKGQARPWCLQPGIRGEVPLWRRAFGIGPSALTEAKGMLNHHFAAAA